MSPAAALTPAWQSLLRLIPGYDPIATAGDSWFDPVAAQLAVDFFPECLCHVEGDLAGKPFVLEPWEKCIVANLFGWKRKDAQGREVRRYRECLIFIPRKSGKTPLGAGIALCVLFTDDEAGQQDFIAAADRGQAGLLFRHAKGMVEAEPELKRRCKIYGGNASAGQSRSIFREDTMSFLKIISADAATQHGGNTHLAIIDELHTQPNRDLVDVLTTSMASANRKQPLLIFITTADFDRPSICNEKHDYASKVRDGILTDPSFLPVIYEAPRAADWKSPDVWAAANPNLGVSVSLEYLKRECQKAQDIPAYENTFRRLHLNQKTETDTRAIPMDRWDACPPLAAENFERAECYAGLDLSITTDLSAFVLLFPTSGGYAVLPHFWAPAEGARKREKRDRVPYETWAREGFMKLTGGDVIDYDVIRADINELSKRYRILELAADRWNATQILTQLAGDGLNVVVFGQGYHDMTAPTKELLKLIVGGQLLHGGHPILRWMASNLGNESDAAGNLKPSKKKSAERIDGLVALIMALGRAMVGDGGENWYRPGILTDRSPASVWE